MGRDKGTYSVSKPLGALGWLSPEPTGNLSGESQGNRLSTWLALWGWETGCLESLSRSFVLPLRLRAEKRTPDICCAKLRNRFRRLQWMGSVSGLFLASLLAWIMGLFLTEMRRSIESQFRL